jgi:hypothetical protein
MDDDIRLQLGGTQRQIAAMRQDIAKIHSQLSRMQAQMNGWRSVPITRIAQGIGFAYVAFTGHPELSSHKHPSRACVLEDHAPLPGPGNALHDDIRQIGGGRYSFWYNCVYFSTSDNSDPRTNGRHYEISYLPTAGSLAVRIIYVVAGTLSAASRFRWVPMLLGRAKRAALRIFHFFKGLSYIFWTMGYGSGFSSGESPGSSGFRG